MKNKDKEGSKLETLRKTHVSLGTIETGHTVKDGKWVIIFGYLAV